jgi:hypothetical protein
MPPDRREHVMGSDNNNVSVGKQVLADYGRGSLPLIEIVPEHSCHDGRTDSKLDPRVPTYCNDIATDGLYQRPVIARQEVKRSSRTETLVESQGSGVVLIEAAE